MKVKRVTTEEAKKIIDTKEPIGLFYEVDGDWHIGIDNFYGHAWVEEFKTKEECFRWLNRESEPVDAEKIYKQAIKTYGKKAQISMVFEEIAELQKELCKYLRGKDNAFEIAEEIADVEIMLGQMKLLFGIEGQVDRWKYSKIGRLAARVKGERK